MARASFKGNLMFGAIAVPFEAYKATEDLKVRFNRVHQADGGKIKNKMVCEICGQNTAALYTKTPDGETVMVEDTLYREVPAGEIVKGFDAAGQMLQFTDAELDALRPAEAANIQIDRFCHLSEIPMIVLAGDTYYVGTGKKGLGKPFVMLREAMKRSGKVAIIKWVSRGSAHTGVLEPDGRGFLLKKLYYTEEIRSNDAEINEAQVPLETIQKVETLIETKMTRPFDIQDVKDTYTPLLRDLIERKAAGEVIEISEIKPATVDDVDGALDQMLA